MINYNRRNEEDDVWLNQVLFRDSAEKWGMSDVKEKTDENLPQLLENTTKVKPSFYESFKWSGKPTEQWNQYIYYGWSKSLPKSAFL